MFDEDLNRQIIQQMLEGGDDLKTPRQIDFSHVFPDAASAECFAADVHARGLQSTIEETCCVPEFPWDVVVEITMAPDVAAVTSAELELSEIASSHGGRADGWGCVRVVDSRGKT